MAKSIPEIVRCPICGTEIQGRDNGGSIRFECCGTWLVSKKKKVSKELQKARHAAHVAFDPLWKSCGLSRNKAYKLLAWELGLPVPLCHMRRMNIRVAKKVPAAVANIQKTLDTGF